MAGITIPTWDKNLNIFEVSITNIENLFVFFSDSTNCLFLKLFNMLADDTFVLRISKEILILFVIEYNWNQIIMHLVAKSPYLLSEIGIQPGSVNN